MERGRSRSAAVELQRSLRLLGWPIKVDGAYGERTAAAVRDFQRGWAFFTLVASGNAGPRTREALRASIRRGGRCSQHFTFRSFRSGGDGWIRVHRVLVHGLEAYRAALGAPVAILSGHRDGAANAALDGLADSQHLSGTAADVEPRLQLERTIELRAFSGIGYDAATGLVHHVDVRHCGDNPTGGTPAHPTVWALELTPSRR